MPKALTVKVSVTNVYQRVDRAVTFTATTALECSGEAFASLFYPWRFSEAFLTLAEKEGAEPAAVEPGAAGAKPRRRNTPSQNLRWAIEEWARVVKPDRTKEEIEGIYETEMRGMMMRYAERTNGIIAGQI